MSSDFTFAVNERHAAALASAGQRLREAERFHMGTGEVHKTLSEIAKHLDSADIQYAVVGGMALNLHGYRRETVDVDLLVTREGLDTFEEHYVGRGYRPAFQGARKSYRNTQTNVKVEFLTTGEYPGDGKPKPVSFPDPREHQVTLQGIKVITLPKLIELKLASGMTNPGRIRDLGDVQELIRHLHLEASMADELHPYVRGRFLELFEGVDRDVEPEQW